MLDQGLGDSLVAGGSSRTLGSCAFRRRRRSPFVIALLVRTRDHRTCFQVLLDQELVSAVRALLRDRLIRRSEFTLRIVRAAVEGITLASFLLDQIAVGAQRALHPDEILLHELAIGISRAGGELAITTGPDHQ